MTAAARSAATSAAAEPSSSAAPASSAADATTAAESAASETTAEAPVSTLAPATSASGGGVDLQLDPASEKGSLEIFDWQGYEDAPAPSGRTTPRARTGSRTR